MHPRHPRRALWPALLLPLTSLPAYAATYTWTGNASTNWYNAGNWSPSAVPSNNDIAKITLSGAITALGQTVNYDYTGPAVTLSQLTVSHAASIFGGTGTLSIPANTLTATNENVGDSTNGGPLPGAILQSGGNNTVNASLVLARNTNNFGAYTLSGGNLSVGSTAYLGLDGNATVSQTAGTFLLRFIGSPSINDGLYVGTNSSSTATYNLSGGSIATLAPLYVGWVGNGTFNQTGGQVDLDAVSNAPGTLYLAYVGGNGTYNLSGPSTLNVFNSEFIGNTGNGTFNQSGGANHQLGPTLTLGFNPGSLGIYNLSSTAELDTSNLTIGQSGTGIFNQSGGYLSASQTLTLAADANSTANFTLSDGGLTSNDVIVGNHGNATFNQTGGAHLLPNGSLTLGYWSDAHGTYNLSNGSLVVTRGGETIGFTGPASFNQTGGSNILTSPAALSIGQAANATYSLSGGSLQTPSIFVGPTGLFSRTGGSLNPTNLFLTPGTAFFHDVNTQLASLNFNGTLNNWAGKLDLTNTKLVLQPTPAAKPAALANAQNQALFGRTHNAGITDSTLPPTMAVAVIDNAALPMPLTTFGGIPVDANSILISQELLGDANIDGRVDLTDLSIILNNFGQSTPAWTDGNFDGASAINLTDLSDVLNNFGLTNRAASSQLPFTNYQLPAAPAPEPTSLAALLPIAFLRRSRRNAPHRP
ncbi:MAG: beta strand repeat-containing protein [Phycisphaerae bacterium]